MVELWENLSLEDIVRCAKRHRKTYAGFKWVYLDEGDNNE